MGKASSKLKQRRSQSKIYKHLRFPQDLNNYKIKIFKQNKYAKALEATSELIQSGNSLKQIILYCF